VGLWARDLVWTMAKDAWTMRSDTIICIAAIRKDQGTKGRHILRIQLYYKGPA